MPRPATWTANVPQILAALESDAREALEREDVEKLFSVSASRAKEIIAVAGGKLSKDGVKKIARVKLLDYVKFSREAQEYRASQERQAELAKKLKNAEREMRLRKVPIPAASPDEWPLLKDVLPKLVFTPGAVTIAHCGVEDLLHTFWILAQSLGNPADYQKFQEMVETKQERMSA